MRSLLFVPALLIASVATAADPSPNITLTPSTINFGLMKQHEAKRAEVVIKNTGGGTLNISDVEATCGCTVPELTKRDLAPGESTTLTVEFNSKEFQGPQIKHVNIFSNDPDAGALELEITADVRVPLYWDQPGKNVGFEVTRAGKTNTKEWLFWTGDVPTLQMKVESKPDWLDIDVVNGVNGDKQKSRVTFKLRPDTSPGRHRDTITLGTNVPGQEALVLDTAVLISQDLLLGSERVAFNYVAPGQKLMHRVRVGAVEPETKFKLLRAEIDIPGLQARVENTIVGKEGNAIIEGSALTTDNPVLQKNKGRMKGTLKIYTDLPSAPVLTVEVTYMVRL